MISNAVHWWWLKIIPWWVFQIKRGNNLETSKRSFGVHCWLDTVLKRGRSKAGWSLVRSSDYHVTEGGWAIWLSWSLVKGNPLWNCAFCNSGDCANECQGGARVQSRSEGRPCTDTYKEEIAARTQRTVTILPDRHHEVLFDLCPGDARHLRHGWEEAVLHPEHLSGGQTAQKKFVNKFKLYYNYLFWVSWFL